MFSLLADVINDSLLAPLLTAGAGYLGEPIVVVGHAADRMIVSSRRPLAHLRAGDGEGAALEMERLRVLLFMLRLAHPAASRLRVRRWHDRDDQ